MSLRKRLLLGFFMVAVALVVTNVVLASAFERNLLRSVDDKLESTSRMPLFAAPPSFGGDENRDGPPDAEPLSDLYIGRAQLDGTGLERFGRGIDEAQSPPAPSPS